MNAVALFIRFFVVIFGFLLGCLAAGAVLVVATLPTGTLNGPFDNFDWLILWGAILTSAAFVSAIAFVPAVIVILIAETLGLRIVDLFTGIEDQTELSIKQSTGSRSPQVKASRKQRKT